MEEATGKAYVDRGVGAFFHYGPATYLRRTPWSFDPALATAQSFAPPGGLPDTDQWIEAAQSFGAGYAILTTKHHDGFCLWPTKHSEHSVADGDHDVVRAFVDSCHRTGVAPVFYYAWHDRYHAGGDSHGLPDRDAHSTEYLTLVKAQLDELLTSYGPIAGIWLDVGPRTPETLQELASHIHAVSAGTAFLPNIKPYSGMRTWDVDVFEDALHGIFSRELTGPSEWAVTIAQTGGSDWGWWQFSDLSRPTTTAGEIVHYLAAATAAAVSVCVSIPPGPNGRVPDGTVALLAQAAELMADPTGGRVIYPALPAADEHVELRGRGWKIEQCGIPQSAKPNPAPGRSTVIGQQIGEVVVVEAPGQLEWISLKAGPCAGAVAVRVDGVLVETIDLWRTDEVADLRWAPKQPLSGRIELEIVRPGPRGMRESFSSVGVNALGYTDTGSSR